MTRPLTPVQLGALRAIVKLTRDLGLPPTMRQLGAHLGISHRGAHDMVITLRRKGALVTPPKWRTRCVSLSRAGQAAILPPTLTTSSGVALRRVPARLGASGA